MLTKLQAQDYLISFEGSGGSTTVDSVIVQNLTQGTSLTVGSGNQLHLLGTLSCFHPGSENTARPLFVYPNPSDEAVILIFEAAADAIVNIEISDLTGRIVLKTQSFLSQGRQSFCTSGLNSGTYVVQIRSETCHYSGKIIIRSTSGNIARIIHSKQTINQADLDTKSAKAVIQMQYTNGDLIKFTGESGSFETVMMDVPTDAEWTILSDYVGGEIVAGGKLKETGFAHWSCPNSGATNETGFSALPGGLRAVSVGFNDLGYYGYWWSSTDIDAGFAWRRHIGYDYSYCFRDDFNKKSGFSGRCIKD